MDFYSCVQRGNGAIIASIGFVLYLITAFIISMAYQRGEIWLFNTMWAYQPILYVESLCPFLLGALACKYSKCGVSIWFSRLKNRSFKVSVLLLLLVILRCIVNTDASDPIYAFLVVFLLSFVKWSVWINTVLCFLGKHSTTMWLTHSYFCYYLFHDLIYGFKYPLLIYVITIACSLCASYIIKSLCKLCRLG